MPTPRTRYAVASLFVSAVAAACAGSDTPNAAPVAGTGGAGNTGTDGDAAAGSAGDSAAGADAAGTGGGGGGTAGAAPTPPIPPMPNLASLQQRFFTASCASPLCHSTKQKAGGISLASEAESCAALVGVAATEAGSVAPGSCAKGAAAKAGMSRVKPGSPNESFLYLKIIAAEKCVTVNGGLAGARMPKGNSAASPEAAAAVAQWITNGAACE